ncbi:MAG: ATP-binding cassette domain-containing protein [Rhodobiaceae bacterium]|nr:ATP-binding cassette domain-containing protein [Rhodobiaceae bacterium]
MLDVAGKTIGTSPPALEVRGIEVGFGESTVIKGLDLVVPKGEILGVVGGSGTGKTVLLRAILGLVPRRAGTVSFFGQVVGEMTNEARHMMNQSIGMLFQQGALFSSLTVRENIQFPMREHANLPMSLMNDLADMKLALVGLPPDAGDKFPSELSGGMIKRAALARALALDPDLLFLDEPTAGLDPIGAGAFDELVVELRDALGLTVYMVTHDLDSLYTVCDRIAVLGNKAILVEGEIEELRRFDHPWVQAYFNGPRGRSAASAAERR